MKELTDCTLSLEDFLTGVILIKDFICWFYSIDENTYFQSFNY